MSISEKLKFINKKFVSEEFRSLCDAVNVFRAFLQEWKFTFQKARTYAVLERSKKKLFILNRIFEIRLNKENVFRDEFVRVFNELGDIFLDILDTEDFDENIANYEILVDNFFLAVRKLNIVLIDFEDLRMFRPHEDFKRLFLNVFVNEEEERIVKPISLIVEGNLRYLDGLLSDIRMKLATFITNAQNL